MDFSILFLTAFLIILFWLQLILALCQDNERQDTKPKKQSKDKAKPESKNLTINGSQLNQLPSYSAVYFICKVNSSEPLYIGSTVNLNSRFSNHERFIEISKIQHPSKLEIQWIPCSKAELGKLEQKMIDLFQPPYNRAKIVTR
ncbi:GIY-YIG nuclease family protein [bacterium]|nr:GIY-YIG nuclease family protein [bacterium]